MTSISEGTDLRGRIIALKAVVNAPLNSRDFTIHLGETPWWDIDDCLERTRAYSRQRKRSWRKLHPGRDAKTLGEFREKHPGYSNDKMREFREKYPGRDAEAVREYYKTPKGKIAMVKKRAERRKLSTDPGAYAARVGLMHTLREFCTVCHTSYRTTHQIDHIVALCLGGTDDWDNLQPLCTLCHKEKTEEDMRSYNAGSLLP